MFNSELRPILCVCVCVQVSVQQVTILSMASSPACLALWDPTNQRWGVPLVLLVGGTWSPSTFRPCPSSSVRPKVSLFPPKSVLRVLTTWNSAALFCSYTDITPGISLNCVWLPQSSAPRDITTTQAHTVASAVPWERTKSSLDKTTARLVPGTPPQTLMAPLTSCSVKVCIVRLLKQL